MQHAAAPWLRDSREAYGPRHRLVIGERAGGRALSGAAGARGQDLGPKGVPPSGGFKEPVENFFGSCDPTWKSKKTSRKGDPTLDANEWSKGVRQAGR